MTDRITAASDDQIRDEYRIWSGVARRAKRLIYQCAHPYVNDIAQEAHVTHINCTVVLGALASEARRRGIEL